MDNRVQSVDGERALSCDREPIHLLGAIQSTGFLVSVNAAWHVVRASENVSLFLGLTHDALLGRPAAAFLPALVLHDIRGCLQLAADPGIVGRLFGQRLTPEGPVYDVAVHRSGREFVLEFEPSRTEAQGSLASLRAMIAGVERQNSAQALLREAARHIRSLTGFDRVMIYRFDEDGSGEVVAESTIGGLEPFLGLRYPASDIPVQARALYERSFLRTIVDVEAATVAVTPALSPEGETLDLSMSMLRSVSPTHVEYLRNMGVRSSMSISILRAGRLWGLIACHHGRPNRIAFEMRSTAELFGQMFSYLLEEHLREDEAANDVAAQDIHDRVAAAFADPGAIIDDIPAFLATVLGYIRCDGLGIYLSGRTALSGAAPDRDEFLHLVGFLNQTASGTAFSSHSLADVFPAAAAYRARAAGLLAIPISKAPRDYLVFFRREVLKSVLWAGDPSKAEIPDAGAGRLRPRRSFEAWQEVVKGQSERWSKRELRAAEALRGTLVELALQASERGHADRSGAGRRQDIVIAELTHRNRNILGLVRGLITQSAASARDVKGLVESLDDRIRSLASANDILTSTHGTPASLHALLRAEVSAYSRSDDDLILRGPDVMLQPRAYAAAAMVVHELVTNARKHGALTVPQGRVTVETALDPQGDVVLAWRETGGPHVRPPTRRGFGSTILEQAIPFEVGGTSRLRYSPAGFEVDLLLPSTVARCVDAKSDPPPSLGGRTRAEIASSGDDEQRDAANLCRLLQKTLVVEDNLFIAVDAEDMLRRLGAGSVDVVKTVLEALTALAERDFSFALLDVNLGAETSLPVALALQGRAIPFVFATGYGDALGMPGPLEAIPIVSKPYGRQAMRRALLALTANRPASGAATTDGLDIVGGARRRVTSPPPGGFGAKPGRGAKGPIGHLLSREATASDAMPAAAVEESNPFVRKLDRLVALSMADKAVLGRLCSSEQTIAPSTDLHREGDRSQGLCVILEGFACRYTLRSDGSRQITSYLVPGDFCNLSSIISPLRDSIGTVSTCRVVQMSTEAVETTVLAHPAIAQALLQSAHVDQAVLRMWLMNIGRRSAEERFAHLFCELLVRLQLVGLTTTNAFRLPLTQFDLGDTMGLSYVHVNRTLQSLRQQGLISLKGKVLSVIDLPKLKALAEFTPDYLQVPPSARTFR